MLDVIRGKDLRDWLLKNIYLEDLFFVDIIKLMVGYFLDVDMGVNFLIVDFCCN